MQRDLSWVKPGVRVIHNRYGAGVVLAVSKDIIKVRFGQSERTLSYPSVFENGILTKPAATSEPPKAKGPEWAVVGAAVSHKAFGDGVIESIDGGHMSVRFGNVVKPFLYSGAFTDGHLIRGNVKTTPVIDQMEAFSNKRKEFSAYLRSQGYAETSANAMASAVSRVGDYAVEKDFTKTPIFDIGDVSTVRKWWTLLESDRDFIEFNNSQNRRFSAAMKHYLDFLTSGKKDEPQKATTQEPAKGRLSLLDALKNKGFKCIDNRTTSSILWVMYEPAKRDEFERIIAGFNVQCKLEKRGALATNNAPAWRIMFT